MCQISQNVVVGKFYGLVRLCGRVSKIQHFELKMKDFGPNLEIWLGQIGQNVVVGKFYGLGRLCGGKKLDVYRNFARKWSKIMKMCSF